MARRASATPEGQAQASRRGRGVRTLPRRARRRRAHRPHRAAPPSVRGERLRRGAPPVLRGTSRRSRAAAHLKPLRIGFIGTGVMGSSMCGHVLDAGYAVTVYTRTRERAEPLISRGAEWGGSPAEVAASSDVVLSIVGYPSDVREVILGEHGVLSGAKEGSIVVDMTTSEPALAVEIYERSQGTRGRRRRRARLGRRRRRPQRDALVHGRRRRGADRAGEAGARDDGEVDHPPGRAGGRPAHEDGQPDPHRDRHDRRLRGVALRLSRGARPRDGARVRVRWGRRLVVAHELRAADARRRLRAGVRRRSLREGHGHRARGGEARTPLATRARPRRAALRRAPGAGPRAQGHAVAHPRPRVALRRGLGER